MRNHILNLVLFLLVITIIGCGSGGSGGGGEKQDITVSLSPKTVGVAGGATQQFTATILNPNPGGGCLLNRSGDNLTPRLRSLNRASRATSRSSSTSAPDHID